MNKECC